MENYLNICLLGIMYLDLLKRLLKEKTESMILSWSQLATGLIWQARCDHRCNSDQTVDGKPAALLVGWLEIAPLKEMYI